MKQTVSNRMGGGHIANGTLYDESEVYMDTTNCVICDEEYLLRLDDPCCNFCGRFVRPLITEVRVEDD